MAKKVSRTFNCTEEALLLTIGTLRLKIESFDLRAEAYGHHKQHDLAETCANNAALLRTVLAQIQR